MELSGNSGSRFYQHKDAYENGLPPMGNEIFSFGDGEISSSSLKTIQYSTVSSSAGLDTPASDNCIEAQDGWENQKISFQEIFAQIEETDNQILSSSAEEVDALVFVRGKQIASSDYNENGAGSHKDLLRNEDMPSDEYGGQECGKEEIKSESSSCNDKGFRNACESVGQDAVGPHSSREIEEEEIILMSTKGIVDRGAGLIQEAVVQPNSTSAGLIQEAGVEPNLYSAPTDTFSSLRLRNSIMKYVHESTKFIALLVEHLLQLFSVLKRWASQALVKPRIIPTLVKMDKNEADNFTSGVASTIEPQDGRENIYTEDLVGAIGFHLGMSIATVLAEILQSNYCLKEDFAAEEISELLGFAIKESLNKDLGSQCNHLVRDFKAAFTSTYKTIARVKQAHYEKKMTSCISEKKTLISGGQMPGLATKGSAKNTLAEYADTLKNPEEKFREKTDCEWLVEQSSGSLGSEQGTGMKDEAQQFQKLRYIKPDAQITSNDKDNLRKENFRVNCQECSCITESLNVKDLNNLTCQTNQCLGNVLLSRSEMGIVKNEIEELSQKLEHLMSDAAECKDVLMGNNPSVATDTTASTGANIEKNNSDLARAINENGIPSIMSSASRQQIVLNGRFERQPGYTTSCITDSFHVKDLNNHICQTNQCLGNVLLSHSEMGIVNNEIEDLSQKLENLMSDSAECKDVPMGNNSPVATDTTACTGANLEKNNPDLPSAINENDIPSSMSSASLNQQIVLNGQFETQPGYTSRSVVPLPEWTRSMSNAFEKSLMEQERCNKLREVEIALSMRRLRLKEEKMYVDAESNKLKRQSIALNQSKASFSESKFIDKKLNNAYVDLNRTCADHLVAGLMLMLLALAYGSWKYSHVNISHKVQSCHDFTKESQKSSWFYNPINSIMAHIQTLICEIIVIGRMLFGLAIIVLLTSSLLRRTVSSSSQTMPTSIILIVLGLLCGYAGKLSVESLGGSGFCWLVQWEAFCLLHAFSAYSPATVLHILNGPPSTHEVKEKRHMFPFSLCKFIFHAILFVLPVMAGLTPFASVTEWKNHFSVVIFDNILVPVRSSVRDNLEQFLGV